jgi:hypothetical protein
LIRRPFRRNFPSAQHNLKTALEAIDEIEEQGEGLKHRQVWDGDRDMFHPEREEVAHYFRFSEILQGRSYVRGDSPRTGPSGEAFVVARRCIGRSMARRRDCHPRSRL